MMYNFFRRTLRRIRASCFQRADFILVLFLILFRSDTADLQNQLVGQFMTVAFDQLQGLGKINRMIIFVNVIFRIEDLIGIFILEFINFQSVRGSLFLLRVHHKDIFLIRTQVQDFLSVEIDTDMDIGIKSLGPLIAVCRDRAVQCTVADFGSFVYTDGNLFGIREIYHAVTPLFSFGQRIQQIIAFR